VEGSVAIEVFVPFEFPGRTPPVTVVRSTLIVSSIQTLRARGFFDAYLKNVDATRSSPWLPARGRPSITPWTALARAHRIRAVSWDGGDVAVFKLGPKEARFDWIGIPYASVPYYVTSLGGFLRSLAELFATKAYTRLVTGHSSQTSVSYRISWA
jgi:hypothetical protein